MVKQDENRTHAASATTDIWFQLLRNLVSISSTSFVCNPSIKSLWFKSRWNILRPFENFWNLLNLEFSCEDFELIDCQIRRFVTDMVHVFEMWWRFKERSTLNSGSIPTFPYDIYSFPNNFCLSAIHSCSTVCSISKFYVSFLYCRGSKREWTHIII